MFPFRRANLLLLAGIWSGASVAWLVPSSARATELESEAAMLIRELRQLREQNRELARRLDALEASAKSRQPSTRAQTSEAADVTTSGSRHRTDKEEPVAVIGPWNPTTETTLEDRVTDLEVGQSAHQFATRQLIADTLAKSGPKINSFLAVSGVTEVVASRSRDISPEVTALNPNGTGGPVKDALSLGTAELDFDIKASNWLTGSLVVTYDGRGTSFVNSTGTTEPVDRFTLDRTHIFVGDFTRFPIGLRFGLEVAPFGTSTGVSRLDTLSINSPLTTDVFENRQTIAAIEWAFPTPPLGPPAAPIVVPPVRPLALAPIVSRTMRRLGYQALPERVPPLVPVTPPSDPPPFYGSFTFYKGSEEFGPGRTRFEDFNVRLGYRTNGHCGRPYEELWRSWVCPWVLDTYIDYSTNVFESKFLHANYLPFLPQIGSVPGIAFSVKSSFGPFAFVGEINTALDGAEFVDDAGTFRSAQPLTWQVSAAYQFDWNPWLTEIGAQGNFISVAYSQSHDMAGAVRNINGTPTRIGFVPEKRLLITAGEWVMPELKVALEYSANWDYDLTEGGTGLLVHGVFGLVQFNY